MHILINWKQIGDPMITYILWGWTVLLKAFKQCFQTVILVPHYVPHLEKASLNNYEKKIPHLAASCRS